MIDFENSNSFSFIFLIRLRELLDDAEPLITDKNAFQDLHTMVNITQSMDILKNVGLLDLTCKLY